MKKNTAKIKCRYRVHVLLPPNVFIAYVEHLYVTRVERKKVAKIKSYFYADIAT